MGPDPTRNGEALRHDAHAISIRARAHLPRDGANGPVQRTSAARAASEAVYRATGAFTPAARVERYGGMVSLPLARSMPNPISAAPVC
jgi:hypothetical protein